MNSLTDWVAAQEGKSPRRYQLDAVAGCDAALDAGHRVCLVAPTGAGKSFMSRAVLRRARKPLAIVHTNTLRDQSYDTIPGATVATVQGLVHPGAAGEQRRRELSSFDYVFIDECHHIVSDEWRQVMPFLEHARLIGATATPERADGTPLGDVFSGLIVAAKYSELVLGGYLCPCDIAKPALNRKEQRKQKKRPDGVASYLELARRADGTWRPGIYFHTTKAKCRDAVDRFCAAGVRAALVCDETPTDQRQRVFDAYSRGELDMLCSPQALAEGFDSVRAEVCVLCRSAAHVGGYLQMCGRVLRPYTEQHVTSSVLYWAGKGYELDASARVPKERALLIDCSDAASIHGMPTDNREYSLDGKGITYSDEQPLHEQDQDDEQATGDAREDGYSEVAMRFEMVRDKLRDLYSDLTQKAQERGYRDGWKFHQFTERTDIAPPRQMEARYSSVCVVCRHRLRKATATEPGEKFFWVPGDERRGVKSKAYHHDCWFDSLSQDELLRADSRAGAKQRVFQVAPELSAKASDPLYGRAGVGS